MNELNTLTLFLSWKCNFFCSHCGFSCGPERNEKMDIQMAKKYIDEASQYKTLNMVAYSGGEPFLYFNEMKELMEYSFNKGLSAGVVTNSSWAHNEKIVCDRLLELKNFGLEEIITSIDDYHLKYVNIKNIENVIKVAVRLGIRVGINILMTLDSIVKQKNLHEIIDIPTEILEDPEKIWVKESSPIRVGRAKEYFQLDSLKHYGEAELINNSCYYVIRNIVVTPDGSTYACCGFGGATEQGPSSITMGGNINQRSLKDIYDDFKKDLLLNIISVRGPYILLLMAKEKYPEIDFRKRYVSNCDVCEEISSNLLLRNAINSMLNEIVANLKNSGLANREEN